MQQRLANSIPHEFRVQILEWLPKARPAMNCPEFVNLWDAYFIYIDSNAIKKPDCPICLGNVKNNWVAMQPFIQQAEKEYLLLQAL